MATKYYFDAAAGGCFYELAVGSARPIRLARSKPSEMHTPRGSLAGHRNPAKAEFTVIDIRHREPSPRLVASPRSE